MLVIVDTLSFRCRFDCLENLLSFLGFSGAVFDWEEGGRFNQNYESSIFFEGIKIGYDGQKGWNNYVHMSGKGCRTFEDYSSFQSWENFLEQLGLLIGQDKAAITRIDLACDERENILRLDRIEDYIVKKKYATRCSDQSIFLEKFGKECLYVGSTQSLTLMRIYNKKLERGYHPEDDSIEPWHRCELQCRDMHAEQIVIEICSGNSIASVFAGHVMDHLRFTTKPNLHDGTQHRLNVAPWWSDFLNQAERIPWCSAPGTEYNLTRLQHYVLHQAGSSIKTFIEATGMDAEATYKYFLDNNQIELRPDQIHLIIHQLQLSYDLKNCNK